MHLELLSLFLFPPVSTPTHPFVSFFFCLIHFFFSPIVIQGPRGFGANIIIVDEAAYVKRETYYNVIKPVAMVKGTAVIHCSSPADQDNWYSRALQMVDPVAGELLHLTYGFISPCEPCHLLDPREMVKCTHVPQTIPLHKDPEKLRKAQQEYEQEGMAEHNLRENHGRITRSSRCVFTIRQLQSFFNKPRIRTNPAHTHSSIQRVLMCIDPNGGGLNRCGLVIGYLNQHDNSLVVCQ